MPGKMYFTRHFPSSTASDAARKVKNISVLYAHFACVSPYRYYKSKHEKSKHEDAKIRSLFQNSLFQNSLDLR